MILTLKNLRFTPCLLVTACVNIQQVYPPDCDGYIWHVKPTLEASPLRYWYKENQSTVEYFCGKGLIGCRIGRGVVISIYSEEEAKNVLRCTGSHWLHEMRHIQGYTHL